MPVKKPARKALAARRAARLETRAALLAALRAIREAKKSIGKSGRFDGCFLPGSYPPQFPQSPCRTSISPAIILYPPHVPVLMCKNFRFPPHVPTAICHIPPQPIRATRKDFVRALDAIELWVRYLVRVFDKIYPK